MWSYLLFRSSSISYRHYFIFLIGMPLYLSFDYRVYLQVEGLLHPSLWLIYFIFFRSEPCRTEWHTSCFVCGNTGSFFFLLPSTFKCITLCARRAFKLTTWHIILTLGCRLSQLVNSAFNAVIACVFLRFICFPCPEGYKLQSCLIAVKTV